METISSFLARQVRAALPPDAVAGPQVTAATDPRFGDYQTNVAMILAKQQRANPRQVAQQIIDRLAVTDACEPPEIAGAGFINFRLKPEWLAHRFATLAGDPRLGVPAPEQPRQIVIDFSSPNVAKPMHVGHIRSTILGDALARIAEFLGHRVVRDNHIGDWGTQFGMLLLGWKEELDRAALGADPLGEMERLYKLVSARCREDPATLERARQELVKLQAGDAENLAVWHEMIRLSQAQFEAVYGRLGVRFDVALGESFYNPQLKDVVQQLRDRGIATESEGAWCVFSDGAGKPEDDPFLIKDKDGWRPNPALVQKSDGAANYTTTDLATLEYRLKTWAPDEIIYVTDGRQQLHFRQLFAIFRRSHRELAEKVRLAHVWFGTILGEDGKPFKTRSGDTIKLTDLLDEAEERAFKLVSEKSPGSSEAERREIARVVGLGAVKYADLLPNRQSDYTFSWDRILSFQGNTAPYLQYSYVRIRSIFRKGGVADGAESSGESVSIALSTAPEIALAKKLLQFGEVLPQVLEDYRPNQLANYLYELASVFHSFFESSPVLKSEGTTRATRLALCDTTARVLRQGLGLLGIEAPERM
ncbi:MAG: arginyl-tRNA synthetase [Chthoniobacter sp.]|jgi:arginyl-tRNA synthetase|nr:arginyl-tRNA synthetase [Chthoniobacter sp.]